MRITVRTTLSTVTIGIAALLVSAVAAAPAQAHETPTPGTTCAMSGMTVIDHGKAWVCTSAAEGAKPRWGKGLSTSKSPLTMTDGWIKAATSGTSAAFGVLRNPTEKPVRVIGAYTTTSPAVQLQGPGSKDGSTVALQRPRGFTIPAGGSLELTPGGDQLTLLKLAKPIIAGSTVPITLVTADGGLRTVVLRAKA